MKRAYNNLVHRTGEPIRLHASCSVSAFSSLF